MLLCAVICRCANQLFFLGLLFAASGETLREVLMTALLLLLLLKLVQLLLLDVGLCVVHVASQMFG